MARSKASSEQGTRARIIAAAIDVVREEGFPAVSARSIAARGGFNQALIFYHFGSLAGLQVEAFRSISDAQLETYRAALSEVTSLGDLVRVARSLHDEDLRSGAVAAVTQLMAASVSDAEVAGLVHERFQAWTTMVEGTLRRVLADGPLAGLVPAGEAAYAICAMFLGIELISRLSPERSEAERVFEMMSSIAEIVPDDVADLPPKALEKITIA